MAIYHCTVKIISRSSGRSSVGAAAYRAGERIVNESDGVVHIYEYRDGVEDTEIFLPAGAPAEYNNRSVLWNAVERAEKRKDAQTAREVEVALPVEFTAAERKEVLREYAQENFVSKGMIADICIHDKSDGNPHAHIMLTTRVVDAQGFGKKDRSWNDRDKIHEWRQSWADVCNARLERHGERIDHRTLAAQGIERVPQIHIGATAMAMARKVEWPDKGNISRYRDNHFILDYNRGRFDDETLIELMDKYNEYDSRYVWHTEGEVNRVEWMREPTQQEKSQPMEEKNPEPEIPADRSVMRADIAERDDETERRTAANRKKAEQLTRRKEDIQKEQGNIWRLENDIKKYEQSLAGAGWRDGRLKKTLKEDIARTEQKLVGARETFLARYGFSVFAASKEIERLDREIERVKPEKESIRDKMRRAKEQADRHNAVAREQAVRPPTRDGGRER